MRNKVVIIIVSAIGLLVAGYLLGYFSKDSKVKVEKVEVSSEADKKTIAELKGKINTLETTNKKLIRQVKTLITQKPDGTTITEITEKEESSEERERKIVEDYESKISSLEKEIRELKNKTVEEVNKKYLGIESGYDSTKSFYIHPTYDVFNHIFIGGHGQIGNQKSIGIGAGIRL